MGCCHRSEEEEDEGGGEEVEGGDGKGAVAEREGEEGESRKEMIFEEERKDEGEVGY